jgi:putative transposase
MARYRHFKNHGDPGACVFLTTTVIDFAPIFRRPDLAALMERSILEQCQLRESILHSYVVMPHHIHMLLRLPAETNVRNYMRAFKSVTAQALIPLLSDLEREMLSMQSGLGNRQFWKRSYRSLVVVNPKVFRQKAQYIAWNPVKAGLCDQPEQYPWSSSRWWFDGLWSDESGLAIENILARL